MAVGSSRRARTRCARLSRLPQGGTWPRVWWATGGLLGLLPLHAAGLEDPTATGQSVLDRVVSSYTPTIRALAHARRQTASSGTTNARSLIVAMPVTPGLDQLAALPHAADEAAQVAARLPNPVILVEPAADHPGSVVPTRQAVLDLLPNCSFAHFACHGVYDPEDPSQSRLLLHDHASSPLTVAALASIRLTNSHLAYISACRTAFHGPTLMDEAIHLTSAFQLAGFPRVIGTLWDIPDSAAGALADTFYSLLLDHSNGLGPDAAHSARALHDAVRRCAEPIRRCRACGRRISTSARESPHRGVSLYVGA
ncbi:CHAT domain-containing protein [Catenulispora yoronensis]